MAKKKKKLKIRRKWLINPVQRPHSAPSGKKTYNRRKGKLETKKRLDNEA
jgi:hypothetical protein